MGVGRLWSGAGWWFVLAGVSQVAVHPLWSHESLSLWACHGTLAQALVLQYHALANCAFQFI
jgi:hypothetical protein